MNFRKDYSLLIILFVLVMIYTAVFGNRIVIVLFVMGLLGVTLYIYANVRKTISSEKEQSVNTLLTQLDKTQKESEDTYKRFLSLSKTLGSGLLMINDEGIVSFSNKDFENYFGINLNRLDYNDLNVVPPLFKFVNEAYLLEEHIRRQITYDNKYYDLISTPLFEGDMYAGTLILAHDITQLKTAEKFQKRFTADVSHELRTPLSAIKGFSEIMLRDEKMAQKDKLEFLGLINKESERMEVILNDLMVISKLDRLDYELTLVPQDIKGVILESVSLLQGKLKEKNLTQEIDVESCVFPFDKVKLSQVILNIIKNGINYTDEGFVNVEGFVEDDNYVIKISDSGIGIKKANFDKIFKRFYRVDRARSRDTGGSGLGLSISKNVIHKHGGTIDVHSVLNEGTIFTISIPLKE